MIHWGGRGAGHISRSTSGAGNLSAIPVPSGAARFLNSGDGSGSAVTAPIVGQSLYIEPGPFSGALSGYDYQVYSAGVAIPDETGTWLVGTPPPYYLVQDAQVGNTLSVKCHGVNGASVSATTSDSVATSAVADIDLTSAITAFTRTSSSGVTPMTWNLTFGSNVYAGYNLICRVYSDSGLSTKTQEITHRLTEADMVPAATINLAPDGLTAIGATNWVTVAVGTTSPQGRPFEWLYPTALSPTDAAVAMTWSTSDATAISATLSGGNLTVSRGGGYANLKGSRGIGTGKKVYWEVTPNFAAMIGVADSSAVLTDMWAPGFAGGDNTTDAAMYSGNDGSVYYGTGGSAASTAGASDVIGVALDTTVSPPKVYFAKNNVWQQSANPAAGTGGQAMASISSPIYPAMQIGGGHSATLNAGTTPGGTTGFTYTPPPGFVAP